jgi:hypothetical protein
MYSGCTTGISHHKKNMTEVIYCSKFWKVGKPEVFWSGVKE